MLHISDFQLKNFRLVILSIFLLIPLNLIHCQEIKTDSIRIYALDQNDESNLIYDINDELCSMVILKTDTDSIKLYSNRGIEKIIRSGDEYRAWLPNGATLFKILIPGFPLYDIVLPKSSHEYSVYIIVLDVDEAQDIIYTDTASHILSFTSEPTNAEVIVNGKSIGKTPLSIENPGYDTLRYTVKKSLRYSTVHGYDSVISKLHNINIVLRDRSRDKRIFIIPQFFSRDMGFDNSEHTSPWGSVKSLPLGLGIGRIGRTGWYLNAKYGKMTYKDSYWVVTGPTSPDRRIDTKETYKRTILSAGITQQIARPVFIALGAGYSSRKYVENDSDIPATVSDFTGINLHIGLMFRVAWYGMIWFDFNRSSAVYNIGMGLGINFYNPIKIHQKDK